MLLPGLVAAQNSKDNFWNMLRAQEELQKQAYNLDLRNLDMADRIGLVKENIFALIAELFEMVNEISWKPWQSGHYFDDQAYQKELVDAWHFFMNLILLAATEEDIPTQTLASAFQAAYFTKHQINRDRQAEGYDGQSTKCPNCKRALDDQ